ncbi:helix-turn-helix domain-containing protein [Pleurocapsa sp. PCC 7327]|uniref:helix-turn-helix domain-containing protein n=1 Tax=Pleurocapsa sp. PCC 7327 TaxID=118163 RepID=UPI003528B33D
MRAEFEFNLPTVVFTPGGKSPFFSASHPQFRNAIDNQSIGLIDVSEAVGYSPAYLTDLVKRRTGQTVNRWIIKRRIVAAEALLEDTNYSVEQIAETRGYLNPGHFFRQFRQYHGTTPQAWRHRQRAYL